MPKWPKVKGSPNIDANVDVPNLGVDTPKVHPNAPDLSSSTPKLGGSLDTSDVNLQSPELSSGHFKFPKLKLPTLSKVGKPDVDIDANVKGPQVHVAPIATDPADLNISAPNIAGGFAAPNASLPQTDFNGAHIANADFGLPRLNLSGPQMTNSGLDMNLPQTDVKGPSLHLPTVPHADTKEPDLSLGNVHVANVGTKLPNATLEAPDVGLNSRVPDVGIDLPSGELKGPDAQLKSPVVGLDSHRGDFTLPHYKLPKLDLSSPGVELPSVHPSLQAGLDTPRVDILGTPKADANISVPTVDLSAPKFEGKMKGAEVDVEAPKVDTGLEKPKLPHFKVPKLSFSGSKSKSVSPKLSLDGEMSSPEMSTNSPDIAIRAGDAGIQGSPKSKLKWPFKWGFRSNSLDESNAEADAPKFRLHTLPRNCIESKKETPDIFNLSRPDHEAKDYIVSKGIRLPVRNAPSRNGERVDVMERLRLAMGKAPSSNTSPTEEKSASLQALHASGDAVDSGLVPGGTLEVEKPQYPLSSIRPTRLAHEADESKVSLGLSNMLGLEV
ncbi:neuroblast differentiation-associated protein AHNAK isoform X2 [Syngnathus acus]|nr:neuroblast differentiation-associated protein AHNAK isoform X2 [Syngnathus acus]